MAAMDDDVIIDSWIYSLSASRFNWNRTWFRQLDMIFVRPTHQVAAKINVFIFQNEEWLVAAGHMIRLKRLHL